MRKGKAVCRRVCGRGEVHTEERTTCKHTQMFKYLQKKKIQGTSSPAESHIYSLNIFQQKVRYSHIK